MKYLRTAATRRVAAGFLFASLSLPVGVRAAEIDVPPGVGRLQSAIAAASPGDTLRLQSGRYAGPIVIDVPLILRGDADSVIDGMGRGRVITVSAPGVVIQGVTVRNSGISLAEEDAGIFVTAEGKGVLVEDCQLEGNLIGIYLKGAADATVRGNEINGRHDLRMNERGNAVHLWNTSGSVVEDNRIRYGRDGIFVTTSRHGVFRNNRFQDLRFAIHYMYTNDSVVNGNVSTGNHVGYALMFSHRLKVYDNLSRRDRDRGLFLNYANDSEISSNRIEGGAEKCVFIYNANMNRIVGNHFEDCQIGIHFTAGSERNEFTGNAFIDNLTQVKYVGTRHIEWSSGGRGNYWSDNTAFDLDADGIADQPYHPNDLVDQVVWRNPLAKLLLNSPAMQVLRWAQSEFPTLYPGGVTDSAPLMSMPAVPATDS